MVRSILPRITVLTACLFSSSLSAGDLDLADAPLYTVQDVAPMMMLVMGRDHTLYYEAYNDAADLDDDGTLDTKFKPGISYEGYFDPDKCYSYSNSLFSPTNVADTCTESGDWSGNFLNYVTMSRMDLLRKVLYGGYRSTDSDTSTVLERAFIPQDAHSWAKAYTSEAVDGYDIADYTPYYQPTSGKQHFFGSVTYTSESSDPVLRVRENVSYSSDDWGVWSWASTERPVLNASGTDFTVRVSVCNADLLEPNCAEYTDGSNTYYKPTGLLHDYGEGDDMLFGLITGSFNANLSGGVLRKAISAFSEEVDLSTGQFTSADGIVATINELRVHGFRYSDKAYQTNCGWIANRAITEGECASWGNPVGEMLYESLRYFAGESDKSSSYNNSSRGYDQSLGLTTAAWGDPYDGKDYCAQATNLLISDINPSYDSDQLPGAYNDFSATYNGSTLADFSLTDLLNTISAGEKIGTDNGDSDYYFIGQSAGNNDGAPTAKQIAGLGSVRGLAPAEPTKQGSYSSAGVAYYGMSNDLRDDLSGTQNVTTSVVSLASPLPEVEITVQDAAGNDQIIKLIPFAKTVRGDVSATSNDFQPTNAIVDWYVQSQSDTEGVFRINFEDVEQGADHDMDMIVKYSYEVQNCTEVDCADGYSGQRLAINLDSTYAAGGYNQHAGYVISGTAHDGLYLEVKDQGGADVQYYLDTPVSSIYSNRSELSGSNATTHLGYQATRYFYPSSASAADFLDSPLLYAAKWGNFTDNDDDSKPSDDSEWDGDGDGLPDAYFPVTNTGELSEQLSDAFNSVFTGNNSATTPVFSSTFLEEGTYVYTSSFENEYWSGDIKAYQADDDGDFSSEPTWSAAEQLDARAAASRTIYTRNGSNVFEFTTASLPRRIGKFISGETSYTEEGETYDNSSPFSIAQLNDLLDGVTIPTDSNKKKYLNALINYLRGTSSEDTFTDYGYEMRERASKLGDVINSTPYYVSANTGHEVEKDVIVFGANDGMVHILDAADGAEIMAYVPGGVYEKLNDSAQLTYSHEYSVDGGISAYTKASTDSTPAVTTVVGSLGTGVSGLYAIDVSDMRTPAASMMKWEITPTMVSNGDTPYSGLGYTSATPTIAKLANGKVGVVFANGYNSSIDSGILYIADLDNGDLIATLSTGTSLSDDPTGEDRPNAMASPTVVDLDSDGVADRVYAGDLYGNMWVFDISDTDTNYWGNAITNAQPLFTATSPSKLNNNYRPQPITSHASVGAHPYGVNNGVLVAFGTGKYIESEDSSATGQATQSFYVIWDKLNAVAITSTRQSTDTADHIYTNLLQQQIVLEKDGNRFLSEKKIDWDSDDGFYLDLINTENSAIGNLGERQVTSSLLSSNKVTFTTLIPDDDLCVAGGTSWYMVLNVYTGQSWDNGSYTVDTATGEVTVLSESSNQKLDGIASAATSVISVTTPESESDSETQTAVESSTTEVTETTCVTVSSGDIVCYDDDSAPTGRLTWQQLY